MASLDFIFLENKKNMKKQEYAKANKEWLLEKTKEEGVREIPGGIYYKVLKEGLGDGRHPSRRSIVTAHYTGRTINGKKFDSSLGGAPLAVRLCDLIDGWIIAMQQMCVGDKWEVYIPAEKGYGKFSQPEYLAAPRSSSRSNCWALPDRVYPEDYSVYTSRGKKHILLTCKA